MIIIRILNKIKKDKLWRKKNPNNDTQILGDCNMELISVGNYTYGGIRALTFDSRTSLNIGSFCSIAPNVTFLLSADHYTNYISTFPFKNKITKTTEYEALSKGNIIVDDDVWIGYGATIMSGVHIGQGAVIAAGAVVTKDVPPYVIVGGVPAKVIKYRFEEKIRERLMKIDFSKIDENTIRDHLNDLYRTVDENTDLSWLPMKEE